MSRLRDLEGIVLKKQVLGDADELVTLFTKQAGKVRVVAKSIKRTLARLQGTVQPLVIIECTISDSSLPTLIHAKALESHTVLRQEYGRLHQVWPAVEMVLRALPDEEPVPELYHEFTQLLEFLNTPTLDGGREVSALVKFKLEALRVLGLQVLGTEEGVDSDVQSIKFSFDSGGFVSADTPHSFAVDVQVYLLARQLQRSEWKILPEKTGVVTELNALLTKLIEHHLERPLKSERLMS
jgi:DNA repair protein RecO (recombination protein O)